MHPRRALRPVHCCAVPSEAMTESSPLSRRAAVFGVSLALARLSDSEASAAPALTVDEVQTRLIKCFEEGQYYVSGKLDRGIFEPDCVFTDPTINVKGMFLWCYISKVAARGMHSMFCCSLGSLGIKGSIVHSKCKRSKSLKQFVLFRKVLFFRKVLSWT